MKNLLLFAAGLAASLLLTRRATKPVQVVAEFKLRGADLVALGRTQDYRTARTQ